MADRILNVSKLQARLADFAEERDWGQFHSPKNLAMALAAEAGELLELFQWLSEEQSRLLGKDDRRKEQIADELADVLIYVARLADAFDIDLPTAIASKVDKNAARYPADRVRGRATKYTEYADDSGDRPTSSARERA